MYWPPNAPSCRVEEEDEGGGSGLGASAGGPRSNSSSSKRGFRGVSIIWNRTITLLTSNNLITLHQLIDDKTISKKPIHKFLVKLSIDARSP